MEKGEKVCNQYEITMLFSYFQQYLTLSQTTPGFYVSAAQVF